MKVALGYDPNASPLREKIVETISELGLEYQDFGGPDPIYANVAIEVASQVAAGKFERGVLICGTGIGVAITANKVKGAYAALVADVYSAEKAVTSNNANIICLGAFTTGSAVAQCAVRKFLSSSYQPNTPSAKKIARIHAYEDNPEHDVAR